MKLKNEVNAYGVVVVVLRRLLNETRALQHGYRYKNHALVSD
jgi:hypothetical protein